MQRKDMIEWATYNCETPALRDQHDRQRNARRTQPTRCTSFCRVRSAACAGALIAEGKIDGRLLWDPLTTQPRVDVKALLRLAVLYNVPMACYRATADFLISSHLFFDPEHRERRSEEAERAAI